MTENTPIDPNDVEAAGLRLAGHVRRTPVLRLQGGEVGLSQALTLKLEYLQHTGSFKARGALNRLALAAIPGAGVIAASGGNHGAAVAWAAQARGVRAEIFV